MTQSEHVLAELPTARQCPFSPPQEITELIEEEPIVRMEYPDGHIGWLVSSHDLARKVLAHPEISARHELRRYPVPFPIKLGPAAPGVFVGMDPPQHTKYRKPLAKAFSAGQARDFEPELDRITNEVLDDMAKHGNEGDLVALFALPMPIKVISQILGGTPEMSVEFQQLRMPILTPGTPPEQIRAAMMRTTELMHGLVAAKRAQPADDVLSTLIAEGTLTDDELAVIALQVFGAGHETTAHMIALGAYLLLERPELRERLTTEGPWTDEAADELLRYLTIAQFITRAALSDLEFGGVKVSKGDTITVALHAANRDPVRFPEPDTFDPERAENGHLTFAHGVHKCVGVHLARAELRYAMPALFRRFPGLKLATTPDQIGTRDAMLTYGVNQLPVTW
ncbi:cytochrome P450 [Micromonospora endolithica]|uniref:Cytochrome P450 n=1 Tax=Micromonospora endolithica TaxID=230091 RepID=A0A3A9YMT7_9ACTN|nr:cytochrome P450 [Micromonospora endolithica]RKN37470.1 cytochrome P450 [Micromonospora endolithica]TWJ21115.1 cytochrome P450 [Micromonospora endolithica]